MIWKLFYYFLCIQLFRLEYCLGDRRILYGDPIDIEKVPYQVAVYYDGNLNCGGAILTENWVTTVSVNYIINIIFRNISIKHTFSLQAGYCTEKPPFNLYTVMVGSGFMERRNRQGIPVTVFQHPKYFYNDTFIDYDFSLLKLHKVLRFSKKIQPIKMIEFGDEVQAGTNCLTSGWGRTEHGNIPKNLLAAHLSILDKNSCKNATQLDGNSVFTNRMICVKPGIQGTCNGDF